MDKKRQERGVKGGVFAALFLGVLLLLSASAHAQTPPPCAYNQGPCGAVAAQAAGSASPSSLGGCVAASATASTGSWSGSAGGNVTVDIQILGYHIIKCQAYANADASTGSANFTAGVSACVQAQFTKDECDASFGADMLATASFTLPSASANAGAECTIGSLPPVGFNCELKTGADAAMDWYKNAAEADFNAFIQELTKFIDLDLNRTATAEILTRLGEYDKNLYPPLNEWWDDGNGDGKKYNASGEPVLDAKKDQVEDPDNKCDGDANPCTSTLPALKAMTRQIGVVKVQQTMMIGAMLDAKMLNERLHARERTMAVTMPRYTPTETSCTVDGMGNAFIRMERMSNVLTAALTREDTLRRNNHVPLPMVAAAAHGEGFLIRKAEAAAPPPELQPLAVGFAGQLALLWKEFCTKYYDPARGDQGCDPAVYTTPAVYPGKNTDLSGFLWGDNQTINMNDTPNMDNLANLTAALRTLISPFAPDPIAATALNAVQGQEEAMARRARDARLNTVWNVMAQLASERASGGGRNIDPAVNPATDPSKGAADPEAIRQAAGFAPDPNVAYIPAGQIAENQGGTPANPNHEGGGPSYSTLREAMVKDRYFNPAYAIRLVNQPSAVVREDLAVQAAQAQITNDLYKRTEEMVFMEAASFADDLDKMTALPFNAPSPMH